MSTKVVWTCVVLVFLLSGHAHSQALGRVFTTPQERASLNRLREEQFAVQQPSSTSSDIPVAEVLPTIVHMGGSLRRRDGLNAVWLNGVSVREEDLPRNARLEFINGVGVLKVTTLFGEMTVRPGQTLNGSTGDLREDYELTGDQASAINEEVARRAAASRPAALAPKITTSATSSSQNSDPDLSAEQQATVRTIVETLRQLELEQDAQGETP